MTPADATYLYFGLPSGDVFLDSSGFCQAPVTCHLQHKYSTVFQTTIVCFVVVLITVKPIPCLRQILSATGPPILEVTSLDSVCSVKVT